MGFQDRLRTGNIFGNSSNGGGMFTPLQNTPSYRQILNDFMKMRDAINQEDLRMESSMRNSEAPTVSGGPINSALKPNAMGMGGIDPQKPMNMVIKDDNAITPFQRRSLELREREMQNRDERGDRSFDLAQDRVNQGDRRTSIAEIKAKHPNMRIFAQKGGNILMIDPTTGDVVDTGRPTNTLSESERIETQQGNALERIKETDANTKENIGIRAANTSEQIDQRGAIQDRQIGARGTESRLTKRTDPGSNDKTLLPTQQRAQQFNNAREYLNRNPNAAQWISLDSNGSFSVTPPTKPGKVYGNTAGPSDDEHKKIMAAIYGSNPPVANNTPNSTSNNAAVDEGNANVRIKVIGPDGRTGTVPANSTLPKGWKKVGQ